MIELRKFFIAISFFTRIPIYIQSEIKEDEFYASMDLLPMVGLVIGGILYILWYILMDVPKDIVSFLLVFIYIFLTGGLHIDGFIDTLDGILSNRNQERVLEIMKDSRIGSFGALGLILLILGYFIIFQHIRGVELLLMPMVGRSCVFVTASFSDYARKEAGLGKTFIENVGKKKMIMSLIFSFLVIWFINYVYLLSFLICILLSIYLISFFKKKLGGMTGDTMGMVIELNQIIFLLSSYFVLFFK